MVQWHDDRIWHNGTMGWYIGTMVGCHDEVDNAAVVMSVGVIGVWEEVVCNGEGEGDGMGERCLLGWLWGSTIKPKNIHSSITIYNHLLVHLKSGIVPSALSYCCLHYCGSPVIFPSSPISCPSHHCNSVATNVATLFLLLPQLRPFLLPPLPHCWLLHCCQSSLYLVASYQTMLIGETHGHSLNPG